MSFSVFSWGYGLEWSTDYKKKLIITLLSAPGFFILIDLGILLVITASYQFYVSDQRYNGKKGKIENNIEKARIYFKNSYNFTEYFVIRHIFLIAVLAPLIVLYNTQTSYFDFKSMDHYKYYIKTMQGFYFSNSNYEGYMYNTSLKRINQKVKKEIDYWNKQGVHKNIPKIDYRNPIDKKSGNSKFWYGLQGKKIVLFPFPGRNPKTGNHLKPATEEIILKFLEQETSKNEINWE